MNAFDILMMLIVLPLAAGAVAFIIWAFFTKSQDDPKTNPMPSIGALLSELDDEVREFDKFWNSETRWKIYDSTLYDKPEVREIAFSAYLEGKSVGAKTNGEEE